MKDGERVAGGERERVEEEQTRRLKLQRRRGRETGRKNGARMRR